MNKEEEDEEEEEEEEQEQEKENVLEEFVAIDLIRSKKDERFCLIIFWIW